MESELLGYRVGEIIAVLVLIFFGWSLARSLTNKKDTENKWTKKREERKELREKQLKEFRIN